jgi:hypothetical protein
MEYHGNELNRNVSNEVELGMEMPMIKPQIFQVLQKQKEKDFNVCSNDKFHHGNT